MKNKYSYDAESGLTVATPQETKSDDEVLDVIARGRSLSVINLFIDMNARLTGLEDVENEWYDVQRQIQSGDVEGEALAQLVVERDFLETGTKTVESGTDENGDPITREEHCEARPWCAGYRGVEGAPEPPVDSEALLARIKGFKKAAISQEKMGRIFGGFEYDGHTYDSDAVAVANITGVLSMVNTGATLPVGFAWTTKDNVDVPMNPAKIKALGNALNAHGYSIHAASRAAKMAVDVATDVEAVLAVSMT